jgi:hypothetical protein
MVLKKGPESLSGPSGTRVEFLRTSSTILGLLYLFAGLILIYSAGIMRSCRRCGMGGNETMLFFYYSNRTPFLPDPGTLAVFSLLALATLLLLIICGFSIIDLKNKCLEGGNKGYSERDDDDASLNRTPSQILVKTCRLISVSAWLACITITGVFLIGPPGREGIWLLCLVWILAILQTWYVRKMQQEFGRGSNQVLLEGTGTGRLQRRFVRDSSSINRLRRKRISKRKE